MTHPQHEAAKEASVSHKSARLAVYPVTDDNPLEHGLHVGRLIASMRQPICNLLINIKNMYISVYSTHAVP